jgi:hypothetical protein
MAKQPTPETIAAYLTEPEKLALVIIHDGNYPKWQGCDEDVEKLIKKRLIRHQGHSRFLTTLGRNVLSAAFLLGTREQRKLSRDAPRKPQPPLPTSWDVCEAASKAKLIGTVEATDANVATEKVARFAKPEDADALCQRFDGERLLTGTLRR